MQYSTFLAPLCAIILYQYLLKTNIVPYSYDYDFVLGLAAFGMNAFIL